MVLEYVLSLWMLFTTSLELVTFVFRSLVTKMGNVFNYRRPDPQEMVDRKHPAKVKLQKQRHRLVSERLHESERHTENKNGVGSSGKPDEVDGKVNKRKQYQKMPSILNDLEVTAMKVDIQDHEYPFENLVFEGGGNKGLAYCGAVRVLEEIGVFPKIKRLAGASAGAMTAALLAVGYNSYEIEEFLSQDLSHYFLDASFGYLSLLPNLVSGYGWNPGNRIYEWFGTVMKKKTNDPDITFGELYRDKRFNKELCVVVTNLNHMTEEYCHPKTTPDMPIRLAVRMSMSIPGMFKATPYTVNGETNLYVDGGVLCNYPVHCFDGWWLSMKPGDSFLQKLQPLEDLPKKLAKSERFGDHNEKTLGFLLYADSEHEMFRFLMEQRIGTQLAELPNTKLARKKKEEKKQQETVHREHRRVTIAVNEFLRVLQKHDMDGGGTINKSELEAAFADDEFSEQSAEILFGKEYDVHKAFELLDEDDDGEIEYHELIHFVENTGVFLQQRYIGYQRKNIDGLMSFFDTLQSALLTNVKRIFVQDKDLERTVGINTGHVGTSDFKLENGDRDFVVEQGRRSITSFLKYYAAHHKNLARRSESSHHSRVLESKISEESNEGANGNGVDTNSIHLNGVDDTNVFDDENEAENEKTPILDAS
ncbi:uncharacterized protein LOC132549645 isoform X2 [Ylistrum balloti]|uniref:uncharacterized protein LOC132549645 isoform X2 n=1 Tax=Ylistrum balloti TaxID=509963 RepID=UPI002905EC9B|nr:uncharacterized protein LOC132549645 isoform X2 [Ylistrum balloti]